MKVSPFFANYGFNPENRWAKPQVADPMKMDWTNPAADKLLQRWQNVWSYVQDNIRKALERMAKYCDMRTQRQPVINPRDKVMVNIKNMKTKRPSKKLNHKRLGPVEVLEAVGKRAFKVQLSLESKNHPVFHVSELELYRQSTIECPHQPPPPVEELEGETNYVVESIGRSRENKRRKHVEYLVF